jgi:hypothetical protein
MSRTSQKLPEGQAADGRRVVRRRGRRSGLALVEIAVALPVILVASWMLLSTIVATTKTRTINRENALAAEVMRSILESMRNEDFEEVFALYNAEPFDDPVGPGTAPGARFAIPGLQPLPTSPDGMVGTIRLPVLDVSTGPIPVWELREDIADEQLGMPRDLNLDSIVDQSDHSGDYRVLPVMLEAEWVGELGPRRFRFFTVLTEYQR